MSNLVLTISVPAKKISYHYLIIIIATIKKDTRGKIFHIYSCAIYAFIVTKNLGFNIYLYTKIMDD